MPTIFMNSHAVQHLRERDWRLSHLIEYIGPLEYRKPASAFQSLTHSVIEQMLSMKSAAAIEERLRIECGGTITPESISSLTVEGIRACGISNRKAGNLCNLAEYAQERELEALAALSDDAVREALLALPGVGKWTCDMFLLFYLERPDIVPVEDGAFRQAFGWLYGVPIENAEVRKVICDLWKPYSSTAVRYLYRALNIGLVKNGEADGLMPH